MGAPDWTDPHGVIPETFRERYGDLETVADALRVAERQRSTTPDDERPKCPQCGSLSVEQRTDRSQRHKSDISAWKCRASGCWHDFDTPAEETTIPMTDERTNPFEWIAADDQHEADERSALGPPFAGVDRDTAVALAIFLRGPWRDEADRRKYPEIARYLPYADSWVGHRVREWRDGEHRELVPDPSAEPITADESSGPTAVATDGGPRQRRWAAYGSG